jgi:hypothetical protein
MFMNIFSRKHFFWMVVVFFTTLVNGRLLATESEGVESVGEAQTDTSSRRLLDPSISSDDFFSIIKASGGEGKAMETLSLFASSPPLLEGRFEEVLAAVELYPESEAARYLASNRYLSKEQIASIARIAVDKPDSELAGSLASNLSLEGSPMEELVKKAIDNPNTKLALKIAESQVLREDLQQALCDKALRNPRGQMAVSLAGNPQLLPSVKDKIGAAVIDSPDTPMAKSLGSNRGLATSQLSALVTLALSFPDSSLAEGLGQNGSLQEYHYKILIPSVKSNHNSKLSQALASNPNITDSIFTTLMAEVEKNPESPLGMSLALPGGGGSTPARIATLANQVIADPNIRYSRLLTGNPLVPSNFLEAMIRTAIVNPRSELCRGFMDDIREKRFRGNHAQKMKIIEVSLTYGDD